MQEWNVELPSQGSDIKGWSDIFFFWETACQDIFPTLFSSDCIVDLPIPSPSSALQLIETPTYDFWPVNTVATRRSELSRLGWIAGTWETEVGIGHTADLLGIHASTREKRAAAWIGAFIWNIKLDLPTAWEGEVYSRLRVLLDLFFLNGGIFDKLTLPKWPQGAVYTLPSCVTDHGLGEMCKPRGEEDFVVLAVLSALLSLTSWSLVRFYHQPSERILRPVGFKSG